MVLENVRQYHENVLPTYRPNLVLVRILYNTVLSSINKNDIGAGDSKSTNSEDVRVFIIYLRIIRP